VVERVRVRVDVEGEGGLDGNVHHHQTLGTQPVGQNLDGVADQQTGPGESVHDTEEPDEDDHGNVGTGGALLLVEGAGQGPEDEGHKHATSRGKEGGTAADSVNQQGHGKRDDERETGLATVETELLGRAQDAGRLVELGGVVGDDGIAGPLTEEAEGQQNGQTVAVALGLEEVDIGAVGIRLVLETDRLLDLAELKLDGSVVDVAVGVVLGKDFEGLVVLVLGHQVTRGLGHPVDEGNLDQGGQGLDQSGNTP